jgi:hypothetical protein
MTKIESAEYVRFRRISQPLFMNPSTLVLTERSLVGADPTTPAIYLARADRLGRLSSSVQPLVGMLMTVLVPMAIHLAS